MRYETEDLAMMVERTLQFLLVALALIGLAMLGDLGQSQQLQFFFVLGAIASVFIVDIWKWTAAPRWMANLLALIAMIACARKFYGGGQSYQLSAVADLLLYLQLILFFQQKILRVYWVLLVLGLLRVVVAATMEPDAYFAPLLILFLLTAVGALTCFYLWREEDRLNDGEVQSTPSVEVSPSRPLGLEPSLLDSAKALVSAKSAVSRVSSLEQDPISLFWGVLRETIRVAGASLVLAGVFFALMPRLGEDGWALAKIGQAISGFSPDVQLHSIATMQQNPEPVFRLKLESVYSKDPIKLDDPLYIQGNVLRYYGRSGGGIRHSWSKSNPGAAPRQEITDIPAASGQPALVRQTYTLDIPIRGAGTLFAIYPLYKTAATPKSVKLLDKGNYLQGSGSIGYEYSLLTTSIEDGRQNEFRPMDGRDDPNYIDHWEFDSTRFKGLMAKCDAILNATPSASDSRAETAKVLAAHFNSSGEYQYSLDRSNIRIPSGVDPIEEFVTTSKKGYCQYFASALAIMLRHRGIPSRLVNGYCTNEFNEVGGYYQVRQLHAHVWVEAFLKPDDLAQISPEMRSRYPAGAWMRMDPTPEGGLPGFQTSNTTVATDSMNFAQILWRDYVVGLNPRRQQQVVYDPFKSTMLDSVKGLFSLSAWREWWSRIRQLDGIRELLSGNWFNWRGGLAAMTLFAGGYVFFHLFRWMFRSVRSMLKRSRANREFARSRSKVEFYDRFEALLKRLGLNREPGQTPREFIATSLPKLERSLQPQSGQQSRELIDTYYQVRFGELVLDTPRQKQIEQVLETLASAVNAKK
jgi:transglutaminase-like putative cysteine protease